MISSKRLSTGRPAATADIAVSRPLGEAVSSPVSRKVGQLGRHSPHWMHEESSSARGASRVTQLISDPARQDAPD